MPHRMADPRRLHLASRPPSRDPVLVGGPGPRIKSGVTLAGGRLKLAGLGVTWTGLGVTWTGLGVTDSAVKTHFY